MRLSLAQLFGFSFTNVGISQPCVEVWRAGGLLAKVLPRKGLFHHTCRKGGIPWDYSVKLFCALLRVEECFFSFLRTQGGRFPCVCQSQATFLPNESALERGNGESGENFPAAADLQRKNPCVANRPVGWGRAMKGWFLGRILLKKMSASCCS